MVRSASFPGRAKVLGAFAVSLFLSLAAFTVSAVRAAEGGTASPDSQVQEVPERILPIGGAVTEIVYALGLGDRVIAADLTSMHPAPARAVPKVGYFRQLAAEPIVALKPDIILAIEDSGPRDVLRQIERAGLNLVIISDETTADGVLQKIEAVGRSLGRTEEAAALRGETRRAFDEVARLVANADRKPNVAVLLSVGRGAPLAGGRGSSADGIIGLAGGTNVFSSFEEWKPVSAESLIAAAPEVIVVPGHVAESVGGQAGIISMPGVAETPAGRNGNIVTIDGLMLLGFGPRTPEAARILAEALHPELRAEQRGKAPAQAARSLEGQ